MINQNLIQWVKELFLKKTGIPKVSNIHSDSKIYILNWTSEDGKIIDAQITKNKKVDILSVSQ